MRTLMRALVIVSGFCAVTAMAETPAAPARSDADENLRVVLVPAREARISAPMEGRLTDLPVADGEAFAKGDVLARFDCASREADQAIAEARLEKARLRYKSQKELQNLEAVSDLEVKLAKADQDEAEASLKQARAAADRCIVRAPYEGRMVRITANQFEILAGNSPLFDIVSTEKLRAELLVPSRWLTWLQQGSVMDIHVDELDMTVPASVTTLGSRIDPVSQTISIYATIQGDHQGLLPGMSGEATFRREGND